MPHTGQCHCSAITYEIADEPLNHALCHCTDCRKHAGAPMVGWVMVSEDQLSVTKGEAKIYEFSETGRRHFCADCGTGLFYSNAQNLPGLIDIQSGTLDDPDALPAQAHIMTKDRIGWMAGTGDLPEFEEYPPQD